MHREADVIAWLAGTSKVHDLEPNVAVVLIEPPSCQSNVVTGRSSDRQLSYMLPTAFTNDPEDCRADDTVRCAASIVGPFRKKLELQLFEVLLSDRRNPAIDGFQERRFNDSFVATYFYSLGVSFRGAVGRHYYRSAFAKWLHAGSGVAQDVGPLVFHGSTS